MDEKPFYERKKFLDQRDKWYAKLKRSGFNDIEVVDRKTRQFGPLLQGESPSTGDLRRALYKPETEEYYRCCRLHYWRIAERPNQYWSDLARGRGTKHKHLRVWDLHSEGYSVKRIMEETGFSERRIKQIVRDEKKAMRAEWDATNDALAKEFDGSDET